jgi:hypothetical protein
MGARNYSLRSTLQKVATILGGLSATPKLGTPTPVFCSMYESWRLGGTVFK